MLKGSFILLFYIYMSVDLNPKEEELCLVDSCTTNSILREIKYFQTLKKKDENIVTIAGRDAIPLVTIWKKQNSHKIKIFVAPLVLLES